jgi:hypothetical protein
LFPNQIALVGYGPETSLQRWSFCPWAWSLYQGPWDLWRGVAYDRTRARGSEDENDEDVCERNIVSKAALMTNKDVLLPELQPTTAALHALQRCTNETACTTSTWLLASIVRLREVALCYALFAFAIVRGRIKRSAKSTWLAKTLEIGKMTGKIPSVCDDAWRDRRVSDDQTNGSSINGILRFGAVVQTSRDYGNPQILIFGKTGTRTNNNNILEQTRSVIPSSILRTNGIWNNGMA